jgi:hypothetical protein
MPEELGQPASAATSSDAGRGKATVVGSYNLLPDPRILAMLGEINLPQWRCIAELIDNSVDGFVHALRDGPTPIASPFVDISVPYTAGSDGAVLIHDNGPGMSSEVLERAVSAGWSGNVPLDYLGLFGMGFNIATARLGSVTEVSTTRAGDSVWNVLVIDFDALRKRKNFVTDHLTYPKQNPQESGTDVVVRKLKSEQLAWFAKASNRDQLENALGRVYSSMLTSPGSPIRFKLTLNGPAVVGRRPCIWGGPESQSREVEVPGVGRVSSYQSVDVKLPNRSYCTACWYWLTEGEATCPSCQSAQFIVPRERRVHGWLGLQRYLSPTEYGIDFLRYGRKIELENKDLFAWTNAGRSETEYPIDDPRNRGRIVGEIHLDHCRVNYTKDRFDRADQAWDEMVRLIRGEGPLRPEIAVRVSAPPNTSPLYFLYRAFRRNNPKTKNSAEWARLLVVRDNDEAVRMAEKFDDNDPDYQSDDKWYELAVAADAAILSAPVPGTPNPSAALPGFLPASPAAAAQPAPAPLPRTKVPELSKDFTEDATATQWKVDAFSALAADPDLSGGKPWSLIAQPGGRHTFLFDADHEVFESTTLTPLDALLAEMAHQAINVGRSMVTAYSFAQILSGLRRKYSVISSLDPVALAGEASAVLNDITSGFAASVSGMDCTELFNGLPDPEKNETYTTMGIKGVTDPVQCIRTGGFLQYAPSRTLLRVFQHHPELFFDGRYWSVPYVGIASAVQRAVDEARSERARYYSGLLTDAIWLSEQSTPSPVPPTRDKLMRAAAALGLLREDTRA